MQHNPQSNVFGSLTNTPQTTVTQNPANESKNPYVTPIPDRTGKQLSSDNYNPPTSVMDTLNSIIIKHKQLLKDSDSKTTEPPVVQNGRNLRPSYSRRAYMEYGSASTNPNEPYENPYTKKGSTFVKFPGTIKTNTPEVSKEKSYESLAELFEFTLKKRQEEEKLIAKEMAKTKKYSLEDIFGQKSTPSPHLDGFVAGRFVGGNTTQQSSRRKEMERDMKLRAEKKKLVRKFRKENTKTSKVEVQREVSVPETVNPKGLASLLGVRAVDVLKKLILMGEKPKSSDDMLNTDLVDILISDFGFIPKRIKKDFVIDQIKAKSLKKDSDIPHRPPIIAIMGHINHGKTTLLDAFRNSNLADKEAGKITQRLGAFEAELPSGSTFTFLDTPGHAAFNALRSRGAKITDMAILVIAADEGIKEQTLEAIKQIKQTNLPVIVAINKCDKYNANPQKVRTDLLNHDIVLEEFGGKVRGVNISAAKKESLDDLEEAMLLVAEELNLRADPDIPGGGYVVESKLDKNFGYIATCLAHFGTFKVGDYFVAGSAWGKIRMILDSDGEAVEEAGPASAIQIIGFKGVPEPGEDIMVVDSAEKAKQVADRNGMKKFESEKVDFKKKVDTSIKEVPIIVRGDVVGSIEAVGTEIGLFPQDEVKGKVIKSAVGAISEGDVELAATMNGIIVSFGLKTPPKILTLAQKLKVVILEHDIIYEIIDKVKEYLGTFLPPKVEDITLGEAVIQKVFDIDVKGNVLKVAGCKVTLGSIKRSSHVKIFRNDALVFDGKISSLKHLKNDVNEARLNTECGLSIQDCNDIREGDRVQAFEVKKTVRKLGENVML